MKTFSKVEALEVLTAAFEAPFTRPERGYGCGRVYVSVSGDRPTINAVAAACRKLGKIFDRKSYYGSRNAIYIGYDNSDGIALAQGNAVAEFLKAAGLSAYADAHAD